MSNATQERYYELLEQIEEDPNATQASLADKMGVAIGTVNWHLKRMVEKGYLKVSRAGRRKLRYVITPEGLALRAKLTVDYIRSSMDLYRLVRKRMTRVAEQVKSTGVTKVVLQGGTEDVRDICKLTCLEQGLVLVEEQEGAVVLIIDHLKIFIQSELEENEAE